MLAESNKIVLVDDDDDALDRLSKVFYDKGIGCRKLKYDPFYQSPLSNVHILFMDINLGHSNEEQDKKRNATLKDALNHYIAQNNGPYALVFWTTNVNWKDSFLEFMKRETADLPVSPFYVTTMAKDDFSVEKIDAIFGESPIRILFEYEEEMSNSISAATTQILNTIPKDANWGETNVFDSNFKDVFSSIAMQNAGYKLAKQDSDRAIKEALIPIYAHNFLNRKSDLWVKLLKEIFDNKKRNEISFPDEYNIAKLNNIFHLEDSSNLNKKSRGAICPVSSECSVACEKDKPCDLFENIFGVSFIDWFNKTLPGISKELRKRSQLICVEISSACDFSQNKCRTNKYLLGILAPYHVVDVIEENKKQQDPNKQLGDYSLLIKKPFWINEQEKVFCFNLNFTFTLQQNDQDRYLGEPLFGFKKEMMDMIGNRYANHISRIGITSFR